jgi:hypothetical protein
MLWTVGRETSRCYQSPAQAEKHVPAANSKRQVRVFRRPLCLDPVRMNEEEVASGGAHQQEGRLACCLANCREQPGQRPKDGAIRQLE